MLLEEKLCNGSLEDLPIYTLLINEYRWESTAGWESDPYSDVTTEAKSTLSWRALHPQCSLTALLPVFVSQAA